MDEDKPNYIEMRHELVVRYGHFRIDRRWIRTTRNTPTAEGAFGYVAVFAIDACSEFDLSGLPFLRDVYTRLSAGEVPSRAEMQRVVSSWLHRNRPTPGGGEVSIACYRRRIGPVDEKHEETPGEWYVDGLFRRPGSPLIDMREAISLIESARHELEETGSAG